MPHPKFFLDENSPFAPSDSLDSFVVRISCTGDLNEIFRTMWVIPIREVREKCVDVLNRRNFSNYPLPIDVIEKTISAMGKCVYSPEGGPEGDPEGGSEEPLERLLIWYLSITSLQMPASAFEFTLAFLRSFPAHTSWYSKIHSVIYGAIKRNPKWYWAPSVPEFLERSLESTNWTIVERALDLICHAEDVSFLPRVSELSHKAHEAEEKKEDFKTKAGDERFASAKARGVLAEAVRNLLICKKEQKDKRLVFEQDVGEGIFRLAGVERLHVCVNLFFCPGTNGNIPRRVEYFTFIDLFISGDGGEEAVAAFNVALSKLRLSIQVEGAKFYKSSPEQGGLPLGFTPHIIFQPVSVQTKILLNLPARKTVRVRIELMAWDEEADRAPFPGKGMWKPFAGITRYFPRAE